MPNWLILLISLVATFIVILLIYCATKVNKSENNSNEKVDTLIKKEKKKSPVTANICANRAIIIFNVFIIVNAVGAVIGTIVCGCLRSWDGMIGCLIDFVLGTLIILLFKYCWQSLFLVIKEK